MKGKLIVFEGIDGSGKTTQVSLAQQWLKEKGFDNIFVTAEPGGSQLGKAIRHILLNWQNQEPIQHRSELLLYAADRAQHVEQVIRPMLAAGYVILCDRFTASTIAYQGHGRGLGLDLINQLNEIATGGIQPDLTLWLDITVEDGLSRLGLIGRDRIEQADLAFHQRVRGGYFLQLALDEENKFVQIDAKP